jgi:hypothetical protein
MHRRLKQILHGVAAVGFLVAGTATAAPCVKTWEGEKTVCMRFTAAERKAAAGYGLVLGASYQASRRQLLKHGWQLDRAWLDENAPIPIGKDEMICGSGMNASCSTAFRRGKQVLMLILSATNDGFPLIDARPEE